MIPKHEIVALATQASLQTHVIEKDYALGWLLAGISQHSAINSNWVFKGGTCLKKCYFETYRFSEDLDFTLLDPAHINADFLLATFAEIAHWIYEHSGLEIPADRMKFEVYTNPRGVASCQGRVYYKGPATFSGKHSMPRIKLLYDVINFFRRPESAQVANDVRAILNEKCQFKKIEFPVLADATNF